MTQIEVQRVQEVQEVQIRPIRLIRGREKGPILFLSSYCHRTCLMTPFLPQCTAGADARTCEDGCTYLRERLHVLAGKVARTCEDGCTYLRERMHVLAPWRSVLTGKPCVVDGLTEIGDCKAAADGGHHLEQDADEGGGLGYVDGESRRLLHHGHYCTPHL